MADLASTHRSAARPPAPRPAKAGAILMRKTGKLAAIAQRLNSHRSSAPVQRVAQIFAGGARAQAVIQRSVLHKVIDGKTVYYSDLEKGKPHYDDKADAEKKDKELSADPAVIKHALYRKGGKNRRANTPYSYARANLSAAPNSRDQGPHTVGFAATEYRLRQRLTKSHVEEVAKQIPTPLEFGLTLAEVGPDAGIEGEKAKRMQADYRSLHDEYTALLLDGSESKMPGSRFHLVVRKLMQMHPATTYGKNVKSSGHGEREKSRFGSHVLDEGAKTKFPKQEHLEKYYDLRQDMFHSSDEESEREDFAPYEYKKIKGSTKEERRARRKYKPYDPSKIPAKSKLGDVVHSKPFLDDPLVKKVKTDDD